jgi:uncharacterized damage-inducible protein DinB
MQDNLLGSFPILKFKFKMKESERILQMYQELYDGSPWIEVNILSSLREIKPEQAVKRVAPDRNNIWEILNHLVSWRMNVLQRVHGEINDAPENNYFVKKEEADIGEWKELLLQLENSQKEWVGFLKGLEDENLEQTYPSNNMSYYKHIHGILQHDAYHLGQIVLLSRLV